MRPETMPLTIGDGGLEFVHDPLTGAIYLPAKTAEFLVFGNNDIYDTFADYLYPSDDKLIEAEVSYPTGELKRMLLFTASQLLRVAIDYNHNLVMQMGKLGSNNYLLSIAGSR